MAADHKRVTIYRPSRTRTTIISALEKDFGDRPPAEPLAGRRPV